MRTGKNRAVPLRRFAFVSFLLLLSCSAGCVARAMFTDGSSVSIGRADRGLLRGGRQLAAAGDGFVVPPTWAARGTQWGTDELVSAIERAALRVAGEHPGARLGVGDLSRHGGGDMSFHRSHENGRDADLLFYAVDEVGAPLSPADAMPRFRGRDLHSRPPYDGGQAVSSRRFDLPRNWALVAALLEDPAITVEYLFISERLRDRLLEHAVAVGAPGEVVQRARRALRQPARFPPHDDHLHLRIRCPPGDRFQGCVDEGKVRLRSEVIKPEAPRRRRVS
ncbi:MAG: hypothetical protein EXR72_01955 [Myxococcales bacterium]|nr:hypothetical protein [Myxococcales bacterium]